MVTAAALVVLLGCSTPLDQPDPASQTGQTESQTVDDGAHGEQDTAGNGPDDEPAEAGTQGHGPGPEEPFVAELTMVPAPEEMDRDDEVGAGAAAEYFLFAYTYAYGTGDTGPLAQMAGPECGFCASVIAGVDEAHSEGGYLRAGDPVITGLSTGPAGQDGVDHVVWLQAQLPQMRSFDAEHTVQEIHPASDIEAGVAMTHRDGVWVIVGVTFETAP